MHMAFLQLLKVQSEYTEMTFDPNPRNAPPSAPRTLNPNTAPSAVSEPATQSQLTTHQQTGTETGMSHGSFKAESIAMATEIRSEGTLLSKLTPADRSVSDCASDVTLPGKYGDWTDTVESHDSFKAESVVMETEKDRTAAQSALTSMLTDSPVLEATSQNLDFHPVTSDPLSPDLPSSRPAPLSGSCQNTEQALQQHPENIHGRATAVPEPQLAVSTAALFMLSLWPCSNIALTSPNDLEV